MKLYAAMIYVFCVLASLFVAAVQVCANCICSPSCH